MSVHSFLSYRLIIIDYFEFLISTNSGENKIFNFPLSANEPNKKTLLRYEFLFFLTELFIIKKIWHKKYQQIMNSEAKNQGTKVSDFVQILSKIEQSFF
jgi:hypothetical protein